MQESPTILYLCFMRTLGFFCWFLFLSSYANAQVVFKLNQKQSLTLTVNDSAVQVDSTSLTRRMLPCVSGNIANSRFESQVGGNDSSLQAVLLIFDSLLYNSVSEVEVFPVGMAKKGIYWGQPFINVDVPFLDVPFVVCVLPKDTNKFENFVKNFLSAPDFQWVDFPQKKDSSISIFKTLNIDEYLLPLPCSHDPIYLEYVEDSLLNLTIDLQHFEAVNLDSVFRKIETHFLHLIQCHGGYCEKKATIFFSNRNVNMGHATALFEWFSEKNILLELIFSDQTEK